MGVNDLKINRYYTNRRGQFRRIVKFFDDFDGRRMVEYDKVENTLKGIKKIGYGVCSKKTFAQWAQMQCLI